MELFETCQMRMAARVLRRCRIARASRERRALPGVALNPGHFMKITEFGPYVVNGCVDYDGLTGAWHSILLLSDLGQRVDAFLFDGTAETKFRLIRYFIRINFIFYDWLFEL